MNSSLHVFTDSQAGNASIGEPRSLQNLALQRDTFAEAGCGQIFTERLSGAVTDRPALRKALEFACSGDTLMANLPRSTVDWDTSQADDFRRRGDGVDDRRDRHRIL